MKQKLIFVGEVAVAVLVIALIQNKVMNVPIVGNLLPGYTPR